MSSKRIQPSFLIYYSPGDSTSKKSHWNKIERYECFTKRANSCWNSSFRTVQNLGFWILTEPTVYLFSRNWGQWLSRWGNWIWAWNEKYSFMKFVTTTDFLTNFFHHCQQDSRNVPIHLSCRHGTLPHFLRFILPSIRNKISYIRSKLKGTNRPKQA